MQCIKLCCSVDACHDRRRQINERKNTRRKSGATLATPSELKQTINTGWDFCQKTKQNKHVFVQFFLYLVFVYLPVQSSRKKSREKKRGVSYFFSCHTLGPTGLSNSGIAPKSIQIAIQLGYRLFVLTPFFDVCARIKAVASLSVFHFLFFS